MCIESSKHFIMPDMLHRRGESGRGTTVDLEWNPSEERGIHQSTENSFSESGTYVTPATLSSSPMQGALGDPSGGGGGGGAGLTNRFAGGERGVPEDSLGEVEEEEEQDCQSVGEDRCSTQREEALGPLPVGAGPGSSPLDDM